MKSEAARVLAYRWGDSDDEAALNWVLNDPFTDFDRQDLVSTIIFLWIRYDYQQTFETARDLPLGVHGNEIIGLEAKVVEIRMYESIEKALELLPLVRKGQSKLAASRLVGNFLIQNDRLDEAITKGKELTEENRVRYYTSIGFNVNVRDNPESTFTMLEKLPSEMARSRIATTQISNNQFSNVFDDDQIERLKEYLTDEDRELLKKIEEEGINVPDSNRGY